MASERQPIFGCDPQGHTVGLNLPGGGAEFDALARAGQELGYRHVCYPLPGSRQQSGYGSWQGDQFGLMDPTAKVWFQQTQPGMFDWSTVFVSMHGIDNDTPTRDPDSWAGVINAWEPWIACGMDEIIRDAGAAVAQRDVTWNLWRYRDHLGIVSGCEALMLEAKGVVKHPYIPQLISPRTNPFGYGWLPETAPEGSRMYWLLDGHEWTQLAKARECWHRGYIPIIVARTGMLPPYGPQEITGE